MGGFRLLFSGKGRRPPERWIISLIGIIVAPTAILVAYGEVYAPAAGLLSILLMALFFLLPNFLLAQGLIALNKEAYFAVAATLCALFNLGANGALIVFNPALPGNGRCLGHGGNGMSTLLLAGRAVFLLVATGKTFSPAK